MRRIFLIIPLLFILFPSMTHATTITCSGLPGGSSCDRCDKFDLTTSQGAIQGIVPRSSLLSTEREFVYTDQSSIVAQAHQNAVVTPVGTITSSYTLVGQGTGAGSWNWATLTSASIIR